jgi:hypothetical protein
MARERALHPHVRVRPGFAAVIRPSVLVDGMAECRPDARSQPDYRRPITVIAGHPRLRYADGTFFGTMKVVFFRHGSAWR